MPTVSAKGKTAEKCYNATREALVTAVLKVIESGKKPPQRGRRTEQANVRFTPGEKRLLVSTASKLGFKGMSDFLRAVALNQARLNR